MSWNSIQDSLFQVILRVAILHSSHEGLVQKTEKEIGGLVAIDQHHSVTSNLTFCVINQCKFTGDRRKIGTQSTGKLQNVALVGGRFATDILIPD